MHQTFGFLLVDKPKEFFLQLCETCDPQRMAIYLSVLPLRLFAAFHQVEFGLFVRNSSQLKTFLADFGHQETIIYRLLPLFVLIQAMLGISDNKNQFLTNNASIFGLFDDGFDPETHSNLCLPLFSS
jgi:hypothetical protein